MPLPRKDISLALKLPAGARVNAVWFLTAEPSLTHENLAFQAQGDGIRFTVPRLRFCSTAVVDLDHCPPLD